MTGVSLVKSMHKMMTDDRVNTELSKVGLPNVLMLEVENCGTGKYFAEVVGSKHLPCVTCPRGFACDSRDGVAVIEECGKGYTTTADGQSSCSVITPKLMFLFVWSAVGVCFCFCATAMVVASAQNDNEGAGCCCASATFCVYIGVGIVMVGVIFVPARRESGEGVQG
jgi:hypothetical protein